MLDSQQWLASGDQDCLIKIWTIGDNTSLITTLEGHTGYVTSLVNLRKGHMASASEDRTIKIWNYDNLEYGVALLATLRGHADKVMDLTLLFDGNLASASWDGTVNIWNLHAIYNYPNRSILIPVDL